MPHEVPDGGLPVALVRGPTIVHVYYTDNSLFQRHIEVPEGEPPLSTDVNVRNYEQLK